MRALADAGLTSVPGFHDPTAQAMLSPPWTERLEKARAAVTSGESSTLIETARAAADFMAVRTAALDTIVRDEVRRGTTQLVILGAGMDGRAWRMPELAQSRVFEVDHPDTQRYKREHTQSLPMAAAQTTFVAVDFEREDLGERLAAAGHDSNAPSTWLWEGVVMYLTRSAMRATLATISSRSAPGSGLVVNYQSEQRRGLMAMLLRWWGEPMRSAYTPHEMTAELGQQRYHVDEDLDFPQWAARLGAAPLTYGAARASRIALARRDPAL
jgi:methyltransferase (TIGR00027 family)